LSLRDVTTYEPDARVTRTYSVDLRTPRWCTGSEDDALITNGAEFAFTVTSVVSPAGVSTIERTRQPPHRTYPPSA
jgi:hypothetical protein